MKKIIARPSYLALIKRHLRVQPICAILGPRQVGKTTLAREFAKKYKGKVEIFDLEKHTDIAALETPLITLSKYDGYLVIIDEIQLRPDLFPTLRVLVDDPDKKYTFLILGSASRDLIRQSSETLAGRIGYVELPSLTLFEARDSEKLLLRGGFPRSFLARSNLDSFLWRDGFIKTFLEKDLLNFGFDVSTETMRKLWAMLCFYHGQQFNARELSQALMISDKTVTKYVDILAGTFMIRVLLPWFENIKKRQVKTPKIYFRDSGIFNALSSVRSVNELVRTPKIGALWEGFALEMIISCLQFRSEDCYFWATQNEAELDLLVFHEGKRLGFEFKYSEAPKATKSMGIALQDLKLDHLYVIFPGDKSFQLAQDITACGLDALEKITELY